MFRTKLLTAAALVLIAAPLGAVSAPVAAAPASATADYSVGPQYDTTHVYVADDQFDAFVASFIATFGGTASKQGVFQVTPTPSLTKSQLVFAPVGTISVFGFKTPVPFPFGIERTGYLVTDMDAAISSAVKNGAIRVIADFPDPIGRDVVVQWPGGVNMQLYWHTAKPSYAPLATIPENRLYLTPDAADGFIKDWTAFAHATVVRDDRNASADEIGQPGKIMRRVVMKSGYGKILLYVSNNQVPWPYGRELTGYEVSDLAATLDRAKAAGVETLVPTKQLAGRIAAIVRFPGGYIAEIHQVTGK